MITGVHTGDAHIDSDVHGSLNPDTGMNRAWESNCRALRSAAQTAIDNNADFFVHAGDAFKNGRPSQEAVLMIAEELTPVAKAGIPIVVLDGNHDRIMVPTSQRTPTFTLAMLLGQHGEVHLVERDPAFIRLSNGIQFACLPWLSKTRVLSKLGIDRLPDPAESDRLVTEYALDQMDAMWKEADTTSPLILTAHATVDDVRLDNLAKGHRRGSEVDIAHLFAEPILPRRVLEESPASYVALSHIHARQRMGTKCYYAGSPNRLTLTDADDPKSVNLVTISGNNVLESVTQVATDARLLHSIDLAARDAEDRIASLQEGALVGLVLAPGDTTIPDSIRAAIGSAGASIVDTKVVPVDQPRRVSVSLPEKINPKQALTTWMQEKAPNADREYVESLATGLFDEVAA